MSEYFISTYSLVLLVCLCLTIPLDVVFKLNVVNRPMIYLSSVWIPSLAFVVWDIAATHFGHWSFASKHTSPSRILGLPWEEYIFFLVIPLCAVLTFQAVNKMSWIREGSVKLPTLVISLVAFFALGVIAEIFWNTQVIVDMPQLSFPYYPIVTFVFFVCFAIWVHLTNQKNEILSVKMLTALGICLFFMIFVNGYLTKLTDPVVSYRSNLGPRIFFNIPVEDFIYGSILMLWVLLRYKKRSGTKILVEETA